MFNWIKMDMCICNKVDNQNGVTLYEEILRGNHSVFKCKTGKLSLTQTSSINGHKPGKH